MMVLRVTAILWVIWGLVHAAAGGISLSGSTVEMLQGIAAGVEPTSLVMEYPPAAGAVLDQHAWNLLWGGVVTIVGGVFIWRGSVTALWVTAMVGGLLDVGYFVFIDLGGYGTFVPGTLMTVFSGTASALSAWWYFGARAPRELS